MVDYIMNELPILTDRVNKTIKRYDCDESYKVEYKFNDFGYRSSTNYRDLLKQRKIVCLGCSFTEGVGLDEDETWPYLLSQKIGLPFFNLGMVCGSQGYIMWQIQNVLDKIQTDNIFVLKPPPGRIFELRDDSFDNIQSWNYEKPGKSYGRLYKLNDFMLDSVCNTHRISYLSSTDYGDKWEKAKDGHHYGKDYQEMIANEFYKNM